MIKVKLNTLYLIYSFIYKNEHFPFLSDWHKLLSINNFGADVLIQKAKESFGLLNCDNEIACYKFNLIVNFEKVYELVAKQQVPKYVSLEYLDKNIKRQHGIDVLSTQGKYKVYKNQATQNQNIKGNTL